MMLSDLWVQATHYEDGSADFTVSLDGEDFRFSATPENDVAIVTYEETLTWRGTIRVSEPREEVWRVLMQSDTMAAYLDLQDELSGVRRERN